MHGMNTIPYFHALPALILTGTTHGETFPLSLSVRNGVFDTIINHAFV